MSKISKAELEDDLKPEYRLDYSKARLNPYAKLIREKGSRLVVLEPDIAKVFTTNESVNEVLRALITTMPKVPASPQVERKPKRRAS
jgi:hypothetical protein